jgi:hypothetical protein
VASYCGTEKISKKDGTVMNRRGFISSVLKLSVAAAVLPSALTYSRKWKFSRGDVWIPNPKYINAEYEIVLFHGTVPESLVSLLGPKKLAFFKRCPYDEWTGPIQVEGGELVRSAHPIRLHTPDGDPIPPLIPKYT